MYYIDVSDSDTQLKTQIFNKSIKYCWLFDVYKQNLLAFQL